VAAHTDKNLLNPWGIAFSATGPFWIADNHSGVSTVYDSGGAPFPAAAPIVVNIPPAQHNPSSDTGSPTGIVWANKPNEFMVHAPSTQPAASKFIFSTEDGVLAGWSSGAWAYIGDDRSLFDTVYKGLAIGNNGAGDYLYATDFHNGKVDVYNSNFTRQPKTSFPFSDSKVPSGFAPFGITNIGDKLYVTYAKQLAPDNHDDQSGPGNGYVDVYDLNGTLLTRLISGGALNSPWGVAWAPAGFGQFSKDLLVANFGDGKINAFNPTTGALVGTVKDTAGAPIVLPGLWAITFGNGGSGGNTNSLYFTSGPNEEKDGLFGRLDAAPSLPKSGTAVSATTAPLWPLLLVIPAAVAAYVTRRRAHQS
jgi:uncharacterized protein (TIGR03118 family)